MENIIVSNEFDEHGRQIAAIVDCLNRGGVIAAPTETVFGLMTAWDNDGGKRQIYKLKGRSGDKPLQMLAADLPMAFRLGLQPDDRLWRLAADFWPGPLTVVAPAEADTTIGLRIPDHPLILSLIKRFGKPLAATSANRSGEPPVMSPARIPESLNEEPDLLVTGQDAIGGQASTVIVLLADGWRILRKGPVTVASLASVLGPQAGK